jgi:hypothetical protein
MANSANFSLRLEVWFVHDTLLLSLLPAKEADTLERKLRAAESHPMRTAARALVVQETLTEYLTTRSIPSIAEEVMRDTADPGQVVWLEQAIAFRNPRRSSSGNVLANARASFSAKLNTDNTVRVQGTYNLSRLTSDTANYELAGTKRQFVLGYIEALAPAEITIRPIVIASRWYSANQSDFFVSPDPLYVWPNQVDQFSGVDFNSRLSKRDLEPLRSLPEVDVKQAFAGIIGEPDIPKDWGGEQFDLWTTNLRVDRNRMRAAIMFKGPSDFRPMTIAHLGKNGDQIDRLASTAADIMVVQHCHSITAPVHNMLRMYAENAARPRRYMLIDGYDTTRILRNFGIL